MILAILDLHVAPMPPTKLWLNLTYGSGAGGFKMAVQAAILDTKMEQFKQF